MSEYVQSLELRIKDNAGEAASGLTKLADAFREIKRNIGKGLGQGLQKSADQLTTFNKQISGVTSSDNLNKLERLASVLERICNATKGMSSVRGLTSAVRQATSQGGIKDSGFASATRQTQTMADNIARASAGMSNVRRLAERTARMSGGVTHYHGARVIQRGQGIGAGSTDLSVGAMSRARAEAQRIASESIPRITDGMDRARDFADEFKRARTEAEHVRRIAEKTFRATGHAQVGTGRHGSGAYNWVDDTSVKNGALSAARLRYEANKMFQDGQIGTSLWRSLYEEIGTVNWKDALGPTGKAISEGEAGDWIRGLVKSLNEETSSGSNSAAERLKEFAKDVDHAVSKSGSIEELTTRIENLKAALANDIASGKVEDGSEAYFKRIAAIKKLVDMQDKLIAKEQEERYRSSPEYKAQIAAQEEQRRQLQLQAEEMKRVQQAQKEYEQSLKEHAETVKKVKSAMEGLKKSFTGVLDPFKQFARIAKYRIFRTLLKEVSEGFSVGLENVRKYSQAINGLYYRDMKGLDNSLLKMKNSIGAATAQAILSMIPLFQTLTHWVIEAANAINQFFALMNGATTWTRAVDVDAEQFEELKKSAGGAGKAIKNLLAAWDELNIIQSQPGGGGGVGAVENLSAYKNMFEEVDQFDSKIRDLVNFVKENLDLIEAALGVILLKLAGMSLGAASLTIGVIFSYERGREAGRSGKEWVEALVEDLPNILLGGFGGLLLGAKFGLALGHPVFGAIIGLTAGVAITLIANYLGFKQGQEENRIRLRKEFDDKVEEIRQEIQSEVEKKYFGVDVTLTFNVVDEKFKGLEQSRNRAIEKFQLLTGTWTLVLKAGVEKLTDDRKAELLDQVNSLVSELNDYLKKEQDLLSLSVSIFGESNPGMTEETSAMSTEIDAQRDIIKKIGASIGKYLSDGTVEGYNGTVERLMEMLSGVTAAVLESEVTGKFVSEYMGASAKAEGTPAQKLDALQKAYGNAYASLETGATQIAANRMTVYSQLARLFHEYQSYSDDELAFVGYTRDYVDSQYDYYTSKYEEAKSTYSDTIREMTESMSAEGRQMYFEDLKTLFKEATGLEYDSRMTGGAFYQAMRYTGMSETSIADLYNVMSELSRELSGDYDPRLRRNPNYAGYFDQSQMEYFGRTWFKALEDAGWQSWVGSEYKKWQKDGVVKEFSSTDEAMRWAASLGLSFSVQGLYYNAPFTVADDKYQYVNSYGYGQGGYTEQQAGEAWARYLDANYIGLQSIAGQDLFIVEANGNYYGIPVDDMSFNIDSIDAADPHAVFGDDFFVNFGTDYDAIFGNAGGRRAPTGMVSARGGFYTSGVSYGAYVQTNNGIINTGATASVETERDEEDANMIEQNRLLREQNQLLQRIANKEFRATPSSAWGDFVNKSMRMAEKAFGT